ncbi:MAG: porin family protein [Holophagaceae bacterium]|nr:porin family protein [Holophagaceae bacterium]
MKKITVALLVVAAAMLQAQEFRFGAQATLAIPFGDIAQKEFLNHRPALSLGVHGLWNFHPRHVFVPRIDITYYKRNTDSNNLIPFQDAVTLRDLKIGVDYNLVTKFDGLYGIAGINYSTLNWALPHPSRDELWRESKNTLGFSLGAGYPLTNHILAEARYTHASYSGILGMNRTAPAINLSVLWRY